MIKKKILCKHIWKFRCIGELFAEEYFYCIKCLSEAEVTTLNGERVFKFHEAILK